MRQFWIYGLMLILLALPLGLCGQPLLETSLPSRATALKVGFMPGDIFTGYFTAGIERGLGGYNSFAFDLGVMPFNPYGRRLGSFLALGAFADLKHFVAFRKRALEGIYVGVHLGGNYLTRYYTQVHRRLQTATWGQVGIILGGQVLLAKKFTTGIAVKGGYSKSIYYRFYRTDRTFASAVTFPQPLSLYLAIHFGYQF